MHLVYPLVVVYVLTAVVTGVVAWRSLRHRHVPGARWFGTGMAAVTVWAVLSAMLQHPLFYGSVVYSLLIRAVWVPIGVVAVTWLGFALAYTGREASLTRSRVAALSVVPTVTVLVGLAHPTLVEQYAAVLTPVGLGFVTAWLEPLGPAWDSVSLVAWGYTYLLLGAGSLFLLEVLVERPFAHPGQLLMVLVVGPPWLLNALYLFAFDAQGFNPTVLGFALTGVAGLFAVGRFKLFDVPLARARVVEDLDSGVLVYGRNGRVYDFNERAATQLGRSAAAVGTDVRTVLADSSLALDVAAVRPFADIDDPASANPRPASDRSLRADEVPDERPQDGKPVPARDGGPVALAARLDDRTVAVDGPDEQFVELHVSDLTNAAGQPVSRALRLSDVSERERHKRELERRNEFLDEFASVVSHDITTPLGVIENKARLVELTGDPAHVEEIYEATERVETLVEDLLELARRGQEVGETRPVDLERAARDAWRAVDDADAHLEVASTTRIAAGPGRLRQMLENLLANAVKHGSTSPESQTRRGAGRTSSSEPRVAEAPRAAVEHGPNDDGGAPDATGAAGEPDAGGRCSDAEIATAAEAIDGGFGSYATGEDGAEPSSRDEADGTFASGDDEQAVRVRLGVLSDGEGFFVADDGPGIPSDERDRVFEQGYSTDQEGTGLGLAIVRRITDAHGWTVSVTESETGGACFEVRGVGTLADPE